MGNIKRSECHFDLADQVIEARIVIGVTGHRVLNNQLDLSDAIQSTINRIKQMIPPLRNTPLILHVLSPLAEGADRLVAKEVLKIPGGVLDVILPLEKDDYLKDFSTTKSREEFAELLIQASSTKRFTFNPSRVEAYEQTGRYIVDQCDVLIAIL